MGLHWSWITGKPSEMHIFDFSASSLERNHKVDKSHFHFHCRCCLVHTGNVHLLRSLGILAIKWLTNIWFVSNVANILLGRIWRVGFVVAHEVTSCEYALWLRKSWFLVKQMYAASRESRKDSKAQENKKSFRTIGKLSFFLSDWLVQTSQEIRLYDTLCDLCW